MSAELTFQDAKRADRLTAARTLPLAEIPGHWLQDPDIEAAVFERTHPEANVHFGHPEPAIKVPRHSSVTRRTHPRGGK